MALDLVGPQEIAERLGVKVQTVWMWRSRHRLPEPTFIISGVPVWHWHDVEKWSRAMGYPKAAPIGPARRREAS